MGRSQDLARCVVTKLTWSGVVLPGRLQETSAGLRPQRRDLQHGVRRLLRPRDRGLRGPLSRRGAPH